MTRNTTFNATGVLIRALACIFPLMTLALLPPTAMQAATAPQGDAQRGKDAFAKRCAGCHGLDQDKEGPRLRTIYGTKAASVPSFKYSAALKSSHVVWDDRTLDRWLQDPDSLVPDNDMAFHVPKPEERADIIRFLRESAGK